MHALHKLILDNIISSSGQASKHSLSANYLGNTHPKFAITAPKLRTIAKDFMASHKNLSTEDFALLLTSLIYGVSCTEKCMAGILLDYATPAQRTFPIALFDNWLEQLEGWVEVDTLCTGKYAVKEIPKHAKQWKPFLEQLINSKNIQKRRAALVFLCGPVGQVKNDALGDLAFSLMDKVKHEKEILITKAVSWLLRSMVRHYKNAVAEYLDANEPALPAIAVRETRIKITTGKKTA